MYESYIKWQENNDFIDIDVKMLTPEYKYFYESMFNFSNSLNENSDGYIDATHRDELFTFVIDMMNKHHNNNKKIYDIFEDYFIYMLNKPDVSIDDILNHEIKYEHIFKNNYERLNDIKNDKFDDFYCKGCIDTCYHIINARFNPACLYDNGYDINNIGNFYTLNDDFTTYNHFRYLVIDIDNYENYPIEILNTKKFERNINCFKQCMFEYREFFYKMSFKLICDYGNNTHKVRKIHKEVKKNLGILKRLKNKGYCNKKRIFEVNWNNINNPITKIYYKLHNLYKQFFDILFITPFFLYHTDDCLLEEHHKSKFFIKNTSLFNSKNKIIC